MQISDQLSVIGFFWWHQYRISGHAKNPYRYTSIASYTQYTLHAIEAIGYYQGQSCLCVPTHALRFCKDIYTPVCRVIHVGKYNH